MIPILLYLKFLLNNIFVSSLFNSFFGRQVAIFITYRPLLMIRKISVIMIKKVVVVGSCGVDFTAYAPSLPKPGETIAGTKFTTSYGGKGANQCMAAAKLGAKTFMVGRVGDDTWGEKYKAHLQHNGCNVTYLQIAPNITTGVAQIVVAANGENQIVVVPGANGKFNVADVENARELIESADILLGQLEVPYETVLAAFKLNKKVKLLNAAPATGNIDEILPLCTVLCVNEVEASSFSGILVSDVESAVGALHYFVKLGCETAIVTLGDKGAIYLSRDEQHCIHVPCPAVKAVDTTGAGDAFVGALVSYMAMVAECRPFHQIVGAACEVATLSVMQPGTQTSYPDNYVPFQKQYPYITL